MLLFLLVLTRRRCTYTWIEFFSGRRRKLSKTQNCLESVRYCILLMSASVFAPPPDSLEEVQAQEPVREVHIDGLAALKIVKHCNENLPSMVTGSLLGLDVDGILQVTYAYPFPTPRTENTEAGQDGIEADIDGQEYQIEMMKCFVMFMWTITVWDGTRVCT